MFSLLYYFTMINYFTININYIKRLNGLTNQELSNAVNLSLSTISLLMNGKADPSVDTLLQLSDIFGYTIDDLLKIEIEKANKFKTDLVDNKNNDAEAERLEKLVLDYKEQLIKKDKYIEELIQDKNVFRNQAEKYMQLLTEKNK